MNINMSVSEIVEKLRADLRTAGDQFEVDVVGTDSFMQRVSPGGPFELKASDSTAPETILIHVHGDPSGMAIMFHLEQSIAGTLIGALDQIQDLVAEETAEQWPMCPKHSHWLTPEEQSGSIKWTCPDTGEGLAEFGDLASMESR